MSKTDDLGPPGGPGGCCRTLKWGPETVPKTGAKNSPLIWDGFWASQKWPQLSGPLWRQGGPGGVGARIWGVSFGRLAPVRATSPPLVALVVLVLLLLLQVLVLMHVVSVLVPTCVVCVCACGFCVG